MIGKDEVRKRVAQLVSAVQSKWRRRKNALNRSHFRALRARMLSVHLMNSS